MKVYFHKDKSYHIIDGNIKIKDTLNGNWIPAVLYCLSNDSTQRFACSKKEFLQKFKTTKTTKSETNTIA